MIDLIVAIFDLVAFVIFAVCMIVVLRRLDRRLRRLEEKATAERREEAFHGAVSSDRIMSGEAERKAYWSRRIRDGDAIVDEVGP